MSDARRLHSRPPTADELRDLLADLHHLVDLRGRLGQPVDGQISDRVLWAYWHLARAASGVAPLWLGHRQERGA